VSARLSIEFRDPADLVRQIRDFVHVRMEEEKSNSNRARTTRERFYFEGRAEAYTVVVNLLTDLEIKEVR
jgi:hypothetical protein